MSHLGTTPGLRRLYLRAIGTGPAHRNDPRARHARANQWQEITKRVSRQLNRTSDLAWPPAFSYERAESPHQGPCTTSNFSIERSPGRLRQRSPAGVLANA